LNPLKIILFTLVLAFWGCAFYSAIKGYGLGLVVGGFGTLSFAGLLALVQDEKEWRPHVKRWKKWRKGK